MAQLGCGANSTAVSSVVNCGPLVVCWMKFSALCVGGMFEKKALMLSYHNQWEALQTRSCTKTHLLLFQRLLA